MTVKPLTNAFYAKDFIETAEGLLFAVVVSGVEQEKILCFLRYAYQQNGWKKQTTEQANQLLNQYYPNYLHYSHKLDAHLHAVPVDNIIKHYQPKQRLQELLKCTQLLHSVERDVIQLLQLFQQHSIDLTHLGITGSILLGVQNQQSDIDLLCYERDTFQQCRQLIAMLIKQNSLQALSDNDWQESWQRRDCTLNFADYVWHEQRKYNKGMIANRKFDLSFIDPEQLAIPEYQKKGSINLQCKVLDDSYAFDYPAKFIIDHPTIQSVVSFTATYNGQAQRGELIEVAGMLEQSSEELRIVVGSSREAFGEYIKVIHEK